MVQTAFKQEYAQMKDAAHGMGRPLPLIQNGVREKGVRANTIAAIDLFTSLVKTVKGPNIMTMLHHYRALIAFHILSIDVNEVSAGYV